MKSRIKEFMERSENDQAFNRALLEVKKEAEELGLSKKELAKNYARKSKEMGFSISAKEIAAKLTESEAVALELEELDQVAGGQCGKDCESDNPNTK